MSLSQLTYLLTETCHVTYLLTETCYVTYLLTETCHVTYLPACQKSNAGQSAE